MIGTTLTDIRDHIESLASDDGEYYLVCARYGDRPVPASDLRFDTRATARAAAQATAQYRQALRRYDPQVPYYDIVVCQAVDIQTRCARIERLGCDSQSTCPAPLAEPVVNRSPSVARELVEFCHYVAAAVFETLSEHGYDAVESAVTDAYFAHVETVGDPDELCLCLLESMANELDDRLSIADQAEVLADAAAQLESPTDDNDPLDATLAALDRQGVIERYTRSPYSVDLDGGAGSVVVQISGYALSERDGRLPVLPLTLELCRHYTERPVQSVQVTAVDGGWQLTLGLADMADQNGLVSVPIDGEV